jgi:hypothetical protein
VSLVQADRQVLVEDSPSLTNGAELLVFRHEHAVPRRQITGAIRYEPADRL